MFGLGILDGIQDREILGRHNATEGIREAARGEVAVIQQGGGRFVTIACGSDVYHSVADRWPEAVDVATLARYAKAFANGAIQLAAADGF